MVIWAPLTLSRIVRVSLLALGGAGMTMAAGCGHITTAGARAAKATSPSARSSVVPWTGRAAHYTPTSPSPLPVTPPPANAPPCTAADLSAQPMRPLGLAGSADYRIKLVNVGRSTCLARGYPAFILLTGRNGADQRLTLTHGGGLVISMVASDIRPGAAAYLSINSALECKGGGGATPYPLLRLGLPGGGAVPVHAWGTGIRAWEFGCPPAQVSTLGVPPPQPVYPPAPLAGIRVSLVMPRAVRAGSTLRYVADLANPTGRAVPLSPCPSYLEFTDSFGALVKLAYSLNCAPVPTIPAHHTIGFAMRMPVPAGTPAGLATIRWAIIGRPTIASGKVRVLGATG